MTSNSFFSSDDRRGQTSRNLSIVLTLGSRTLQPLFVKAAARASSDHRRIGHGDGAERLAHLQPGHNLRHVRYQALRQVANLGAWVGNDFLALAVIEFLRHLKRLARRPAKARTA